MRYTTASTCVSALASVLRIGEALDLRWDIDVDLGAKTLLTRRLKGGRAGLHPLRDDEVQQLEDLRALYPEGTFVFPSSRTGAKLTKSTINRLFERLGLFRSRCARTCCGIRLVPSSCGRTG